jgi:predicted HTH transcriptional regulator
MSNERYKARLREARGMRNVDFKAAFNGRSKPRCTRLELLKDIAAMANSGGGCLIIGRDEPYYTTGSLTQEQVDSFDTTCVLDFVHGNLSPTLAFALIRDYADDGGVAVNCRCS